MARRNSGGDSHRAVEDSKKRLDEIRRRQREVTSVAADLRKARTHDSFEERVDRIFGR